MTKRLLFIVSLIATLLLAISCDKVELPSATTGTEEEEQTSEEDETGTGSETDTDTTSESTATYLTVAQALEETAESQDIKIRGYIVGYINGNSIQNAVFALPDEVNTNFLLADSPSETNPENCLPVLLATSGIAPRADFNLYEHPEYFHCAILVRGYLETYFRRNGIKKILDLKILSEDNTSSDDSGDEEDTEDSSGESSGEGSDSGDSSGQTGDSSSDSTTTEGTSDGEDTAADTPILSPDDEQQLEGR